MRSVACVVNMDCFSIFSSCFPLIGRKAWIKEDLAVNK